MNNDIRQILDELYAMDKNLKKHEAELVEIINTLIASRPQVKFDESFKKELGAKLLERLEKFQKKPDEKKGININLTLMNKLFYGLGGMALALLIIIPLLKTQSPNLLPTDYGSVNFGLEVDKISKNAFGPLVSIQGTQATADSALGRGEAVGLGGGGQSAASAPDVIGIMPPEYVNFSYSFDGEIPVPDQELPVYKKVKGNSASGNLARLLQQSKFDIIDISSFDNSQLRNFNIIEDKPYGYSVYIDLYEGIMSIYENWERWPHPPVLETLTIDQVPGDDVLIAIADKFLADKKINISQYGKPAVEDNWRVFYNQAEDASSAYVPDNISVVYPQLINGETVYEEYGGYYGLRVNINIREKRASGAWGISSQKYQSSLYQMETDTSRLKKLLEQGGGYPLYTDANSRTAEVKLGEPTMSYSIIWQNDANGSYQLYVPALVFPVVEAPDAGYFNRENIVLPLAKDIVENRLNPNQEDYPLPVPLK